MCRLGKLPCSMGIAPSSSHWFTRLSNRSGPLPCRCKRASWSEAGRKGCKQPKAAGPERCVRAHMQQQRRCCTVPRVTHPCQPLAAFLATLSRRFAVEHLQMKGRCTCGIASWLPLGPPCCTWSTKLKKLSMLMDGSSGICPSMSAEVCAGTYMRSGTQQAACWCQQKCRPSAGCTSEGKDDVAIQAALTLPRPPL